ncbi:hypothetical protein PsorP6_015086 [Peronosclerospora sorghi]|uniref:Uncharacterized protein n=1 Tax=Peronosclerospora sorghi TaxID=230839 RepID=A0ACC0VSN6_9STRA|nr:hypothetical protein PsorP6_015086 [Peronosclerospora sorghi]
MRISAFIAPLLATFLASDSNAETSSLATPNITTRRLREEGFSSPDSAAVEITEKTLNSIQRYWYLLINRLHYDLKIPAETTFEEVFQSHGKHKDHADAFRKLHKELSKSSNLEEKASGARRVEKLFDELDELQKKSDHTIQKL